MHIANKSETSLIESVNIRIRNYLARFNRRTKIYSKSIDMIEYGLYLLFDKLYWNMLINWYIKVSNAKNYTNYDLYINKNNKKVPHFL